MQVRSRSYKLNSRRILSPMMDKQTEQALLSKCLFQIEKKLGWGDAAEWPSDVFEELSETILQETNTLLSPTTLKRVWGKVNYNSSPSASTLNTLAQFAGYLNWRDFKNTFTVLPTAVPSKSKFSQIGVFGYVAIIGVLVISILLALGAKSTKNAGFDYSKIAFSSRPITKGIPNSVVFDFDLAGLSSDSIYIQQFWDATKTIKIKPGQSQATGQYYYPGYYRAKLLVEGNIKKEHDLFIKSKGWLGTIDFEPIPKYYDEIDIVQNYLMLPKTALKEIETSEQPLYYSFHFIDQLGSNSGDNFILETAFKNIYNDKWAVCASTNLVVVGTKSALIIPFSIPGCVSTIGLMMSEISVSGKENDLSMFGTDLSKFQKFKILVENKSVMVSIDDHIIYTGHYTESIGNIVGIRYRFLGAGAVDYLTLKTPGHDEFVLHHDFNLIH